MEVTFTVSLWEENRVIIQAEANSEDEAQRLAETLYEQGEGTKENTDWGVFNVTEE